MDKTEKSTISEDSIFYVNHDVVIRDDDYVLYKRKNGTIVKLNTTGFILVRLINGTRTVREISEALAMEMNTEVDIVISDSLEFYLSLFEKEIIATDNNTLR